MMTHRERQLATIRHEPTDHVSLDAIAIEILPRIADFLGIPRDDARVLDRLGIDGRCLMPWDYQGAMPVGPNDELRTAWGTESFNDYGGGHDFPLAQVASVSDVEHYPWWPNPTLYDYAGTAVTMRQVVERYATRGPGWKPLFCQVCELMGMEEAMVRMHTEPAIFEAVLEQVFQHVYGYSRRFLDACGDALDIYLLCDDFATQRGMMISPEQWRHWLKPRYAALFALAKSHGKFVWFHSCGDITPVLADLIEIGMDVWETVQLHTLPLTPEALKREYGEHLTFFGGINTQRLPFVTPREVREEVRSCIEILGKNGGYICGPDHHIKPDVPPENAVALFEAATEG